MSMKLSDVDMIKLLPPFMRSDETDRALSGAINQLFRDPGQRVQQNRIWDQIDNLNDEQLDEIAWELNIDWYSSSMEISRKRATIKVAQQVMEKRGTKWDVEQLISAYFGPGYVKEWFEDDGDPFTFKVLTTNPSIGDDDMVNFMRQVNVAKSARSHLDGVYYFEELQATVLCYPTSTAHIFEYVKCGTRPRRATLGAVDKTLISVEPTAKEHGFTYIHAGDGTKTGTYPGTATLGKIDATEIQLDPDATALQFEYGTKAGDGTKAGTFPRTTSLGEITQAAVEAAGSSNAMPFEYIRRAGTTPRASTLGEETQAAVETDGSANALQFNYIRQAGTTPDTATLGEETEQTMEAAGTTTVHCFTYTKCGTKRCGE